jgi:hypothetical protein
LARRLRWPSVTPAFAPRVAARLAGTALLIGISSMPLRLLTLIAALTLLTPALQADLIQGRVVDSNGVGVAGVDIDAKNLLGGDDPTLFNDGTDANGFFSTTIPAGQYRLTFNPPPPPTTTHLVAELDDVIVVGTVNLGDVALAPGVSLSGHVQTGAGFPVAAVNLDVIDLASGDNLTTVNDFTDAFGNFNVAAPIGPVELRLDTTPIAAPLLAPTTVELDLTGDTAVGNITLQPGFLLSAFVRRSNGTPVEGADTDTTDALTESDLYTPGDNTDDVGFVDVIVPAGTFDFEVCPLFTDGLVAATVKDVVVNSNLHLGVITLQNGVVLSGTVQNGSSAPLGNVDVDVRHSGSGVAVTLCADNTAANGTYAVLVPTGTFDVTFTPPYSQPYGSQVVASVNVPGNTIVNGNLPDCPFHTLYGAGLAGSGGLVPQLDSSGGAPRIGNPDWTLEISNGRGGSLCTLIFGFGPASIPFKQGTLLVDIVSFPSVFLTLPLSGPAGVPGAGAFNLPIPATPPIFAGLTWYTQAFVSDPGAPAGFAMSGGMHVTYCP